MTDKVCERKIFISSTIRNLRDEREAVRKRLKKPFNHVRFQDISSENPETLHMSGEDLRIHAGDNPNLFILNQIKYTDYFLMLLNDDYYGEEAIGDSKLISGQEKKISITHAEFRTALRLDHPIFAFIEENTMHRYFWTFGGRFFGNKLKDRDVRVYNLIRELRSHRKRLGVTIATYSSIEELVKKMEYIFNTYDKSKYVFSEFDEEVCKGGDKIIGFWEVINEGCVVWEKRFFLEKNAPFKRFVKESAKTLLRAGKESVPCWKRFLSFLRKWLQYLGIVIRSRKSTADKSCYPIKTIYPGERARLEVTYTAPCKKGEIISSWIMVDLKGNRIYKNLAPLEESYFVED